MPGSQRLAYVLILFAMALGILPSFHLINVVSLTFGARVLVLLVSCVLSATAFGLFIWGARRQFSSQEQVDESA